MPRSGGTYFLPAGSIVVDGTTIEATQHNTPLNDIAADLNAVRPISAGGTGATSAAAAWATFAAAAPVNGAGAVPPGGIIMWSGSVASIPSGWALCDGASGTPDLRERFIVGAGSTYAVGATGGANTVALTEAQLPSHTHGAGSLTAASGGAHTHEFFHGVRVADQGGFGGSFFGSPIATPSAPGVTENRVRSDMVTANNSAHTHPITGSTASAGSGQAHENRPPYYALALIMKL